VENVVASDIFEPKTPLKGKFEKLDVTDFKNYEKLVKDNKITQIIHFGAILSGKNMNLFSNSAQQLEN
jgi:UDP-glucose 4-epimerase